MGFPSVQQSSANATASFLPLAHDNVGSAIGGIVGACSFAIIATGMLLSLSVISLGCAPPTAASAPWQHITQACTAAAFTGLLSRAA